MNDALRLGAFSTSILRQLPIRPPITHHWSSSGPTSSCDDGKHRFRVEYARHIDESPNDIDFVLPTRFEVQRLTSETFERAIGQVIGKPVATLFVESGNQRRFILEIILGTVGAYLGGKFLDGFIKGLGIGTAGEALGEKVRGALKSLEDLIVGNDDASDRSAELRQQAIVLQDVASELAQYSSNRDAVALAEKAMCEVLCDKGVRPAEAQRIARAVGQKILQG